MSLELEKKGNHFPNIILTTLLHIQRRFDIWMCHRNIQVEFDFGFGQIIFDFLPLELKKNSQFPLSDFLKGCIYKADISFVGFS